MLTALLLASAIPAADTNPLPENMKVSREDIEAATCGPKVHIALHDGEPLSMDIRPLDESNKGVVIAAVDNRVNNCTVLVTLDNEVRPPIKLSERNAALKPVSSR